MCEDIENHCNAAICPKRIPNSRGDAETRRRGGEELLSPRTPRLRVSHGFGLLVAAAVEPDEFADGRAGHLFEALAVRFDGAGGLVEEDPFDAEEGDEHGDEIEVGLLVAGDLMDPVFERIEIDAAHGHTGGGEGHQHSEELLL